MSDNAVEEPTSAFHESGVEGFSPVVERFPAGAKACYRWIALVPLMVLLALPTLAPCAIASLVLWNDCSSLQWYLNPLPYVAGGNMVQIVSSVALGSRGLAALDVNRPVPLWAGIVQNRNWHAMAYVAMVAVVVRALPIVPVLQTRAVSRSKLSMPMVCVRSTVA